MSHYRVTINLLFETSRRNIEDVLQLARAKAKLERRNRVPITDIDHSTFFMTCMTFTWSNHHTNLIVQTLQFEICSLIGKI